jgi:crotonobetainyl-CoA:carnitine CoA-transferase CaiB-like acyl-CoA transferase
MLVEIDQPRVGKMRIVGSPIRLSECRVKSMPRPSSGGAFEQVLKDILGYTKAEIELLKTENVINREV